MTTKRAPKVTPESHYNIKLAEPLRQQLKIRAALEGKTIPQVITEACAAHVQKPINLDRESLASITDAMIGREKIKTV